MSALTVRNLDDAVMTQLRMQAALHSCTMEEEVRCILTLATLGEVSGVFLGSRIHARFKSLGSVEAPVRSYIRR